MDLYDVLNRRQTLLASEQEASGKLTISFMFTVVLCTVPTLMVLCPVLGRLLPLVKEFSSPTEKGVWNEEMQPALPTGF